MEFPYGYVGETVGTTRKTRGKTRVKTREKILVRIAADPSITIEELAVQHYGYHINTILALGSG